MLEAYPVTVTNMEMTQCFLLRHRETALFLQCNIRDHGTALGEAMNSGNMRCLSDGQQICGVFSLTRRGNLMIQTDGVIEPWDLVLDTVAADPVEIEGVVGPWHDAEPLWNAARRRDPNLRPRTVSRHACSVSGVARPRGRWRGPK